MKYVTTITFENKYHRDLFEDWMSNLGEQLFDNQLEVEKTNVVDVPKNLRDQSLLFKYPKVGKIETSCIKDE